MKESKKLNLFKETLKKAKEGDLYNYDRWLKNKGFNPRKLTIEHVSIFFNNNPDLIIGHEENIELINRLQKEVYIVVLELSASLITCLINKNM